MTWTEFASFLEIGSIPSVLWSSKPGPWKQQNLNWEHSTICDFYLLGQVRRFLEAPTFLRWFSSNVFQLCRPFDHFESKVKLWIINADYNELTPNCDRQVECCLCCNHRWQNPLAIQQTLRQSLIHKIIHSINFKKLSVFSNLSQFSSAEWPLNDSWRFSRNDSNQCWQRCDHLGPCKRRE